MWSGEVGREDGRVRTSLSTDITLVGVSTINGSVDLRFTTFFTFLTISLASFFL